jgi:hypothetical protein
MRFIPILTLATVFFGAVSSLAVPISHKKLHEVSKEVETSNGHRTSALSVHPDGQHQTHAAPVAPGAGSLEAREPLPEPGKAKVTFSGGARKHLDNLGLHGPDRAKAKKWHSGLVKAAMKKVGASTAQIKHLAHGVGSKDSKVHITAIMKDHAGKVVKSTHGDPPKKGNMHHVHVPPNAHVNTAYKNAVAKKGKKL